MPYLDNVIYKGNTGGSVIIPDSAIGFEPQPIVYSCIYCADKFFTEDDLRSHKAKTHPIKRPFILLRGREIRQDNFTIRCSLADSEIGFIDVDRVVLSDNTEITPDELKRMILNKSSGVIRFAIWHQIYSVTYSISFSIFGDDDLEKTENLFFEVFGSGLTLSNSLELFNTRVRGTLAVKPYAAALGAYITAIMTKDRLPEAWLDYGEYNNKLGEAYDGLDEYSRPLAQYIISIIRFMRNDFSIVKIDNMMPNLRCAKSFFLGGSSTRLSGDHKNTKTIPIDLNTEQLINYCYLSEAAKVASIDVVKAMYGTSLTNQQDKEKSAFMLWNYYKSINSAEAKLYRNYLSHSQHFNLLIHNLESN